MSEGFHHTRQSPTKRRGDEAVADFTLLVRVPGQPAATKSFTDAEQDQAQQYAEATGGTVVPLPLPPPAGYTTDPHGNLVPLPAQ
ncbi:hypothetical protein BVC93_31340 (plasmid) [Mycobacterium sp. MS1601]|uniref:hypothetical protein n=1 Tax=Mycobacterium sp. MS1601 TaxID=1936029 RepID=UPI0009791F4B|nr:hypothetical protein [Mycobacterium sp. MS1601]AQA06993.1 hypothetical protein BVC93_31340 [Mycobacterium sp. MS1601]